MVQKTKKDVIAVVGLGYVGLPLAVAFGKTKLETIGFDINSKRIEELERGLDRTDEVSNQDLKSTRLKYTDQENDLKKANFFIVAVPTPVTEANQPDLKLVKLACELVGKVISQGALVVFESTVYPGVTEEICAPIIEKVSKLKWQKDFFLGYSPERINPGDKEHTLQSIVKVISGDNSETTKRVARVYSKVCKAGVYEATNIKTAEAAKVIENTQRDINIALINELSLIFHRMDIDTNDVLAAAGTKWNFLPFKPGLVGGHCIGVDPYYLVYKAKKLGYNPEVIASGRKVNDYMSQFVFEQTIQGLNEAKKSVKKSKVLVMGLTFKENVPDSRNSRISQTIKSLQKMGVTVAGYDPYLSPEEISRQFGIESISKLNGSFDAVIVATAHSGFEKKLKTILSLMGKSKPVLIDIKGIFRQERNKSNLIYKTL